MADWQENVELHRIYLDARSHRNSFFEKLAILDGGTVALVITAVLGPLHGTIRHKYSLGVGLTSLVFAMLVLLYRNFVAAQFEFVAAGQIAGDPRTDSSQIRAMELRYKKLMSFTQSTGLLLSGVGVLLLLIQIWLILI
jgi:hypothetical protein